MAVYSLPEMEFCHQIVINLQSFTERVLGDFQSTIEVAPQSGYKMESDGQGKIMAPKPCYKGSRVRVGVDPVLHFLSDEPFVFSTGAGKYPPTLHGSVLVVDAWG
jgi:hypothetical protein